MLIPFDSLPETSRIWVYQANRSFTEKELTDISAELEQFIQQWTAHQTALEAGFEIRYKRFLVIAQNQQLQLPSGCAIDSLVHCIQGFEKKYKVDLLDNMNVSFKQGAFIAYKPLADFRKMAKERAVSPNTIVFNNLVLSVSEYRSQWEVPAKESWHQRFLNG